MTGVHIRRRGFGRRHAEENHVKKQRHREEARVPMSGHWRAAAASRGPRRATSNPPRQEEAGKDSSPQALEGTQPSWKSEVLDCRLLTP